MLLPSGIQLAVLCCCLLAGTASLPGELGAAEPARSCRSRISISNGAGDARGFGVSERHWQRWRGADFREEQEVWKRCF